MLRWVLARVEGDYGIFIPPACRALARGEGVPTGSLAGAGLDYGGWRAPGNFSHLFGCGMTLRCSVHICWIWAPPIPCPKRHRSGMANIEHAPAARYTKKLVFWEEPQMADLIEKWADEGATSQGSILRLALRQFFKVRVASDDLRVG